MHFAARLRHNGQPLFLVLYWVLVGTPAACRNSIQTTPCLLPLVNFWNPLASLREIAFYAFRCRLALHLRIQVSILIVSFERILTPSEAS